MPESIYTFPVSSGDASTLVKTVYEIKAGPGSTLGQALANDETVRRYIRSTFEYMYQVAMGRALVDTVLGLDGHIKIWFYNTNAYDPAAGVIKWNPFTFAWFLDTARSWTKRNEIIPNGFDGSLIVRPSSEEYELDRSGSELVFGICSPGTMFFHELGHRYQHIRRKHYFTDAFRQVAKQSKHLIVGDSAGLEFHAEDTFAPWETDNVNWNETPFIKQLRVNGVCEAMRWHYCDTPFAFQADDWEVVDSAGAKAFRFKTAGATDWQHSNCFFQIKGARTTPPVVYNQQFKTRQQQVETSISGTVYYPSQDQIAEWLTTQNP